MTELTYRESKKRLTYDKLDSSHFKIVSTTCHRFLIFVKQS